MSVPLGTAAPGPAPAVAEAASPVAVFPGDSEMARRCRALDWAATPLGPVDGWPPALVAAVRLALDAPGAMSLYAGPGFVTLYNDAYRRVLGAKHPGALGRPAATVWAELWAVIGPQYAHVRAGGALDLHDVPFAVARLDGGGADAAWFDYALSPVRAEGARDVAGDGAVVAVLSVVTETTGRVRAEAERAALVDALRAANAELRDRQGELERANGQLRAQAAELAATAEALQATAAHLEEQTEAADTARAAAEAAGDRTRAVLA